MGAGVGKAHGRRIERRYEEVQYVAFYAAFFTSLKSGTSFSKCIILGMIDEVHDVYDGDEGSGDGR